MVWLAVYVTDAQLYCSAQHSFRRVDVTAVKPLTIVRCLTAPLGLRRRL